MNLLSFYSQFSSGENQPEKISVPETVEERQALIEEYFPEPDESEAESASITRAENEYIALHYPEELKPEPVEFKGPEYTPEVKQDTLFFYKNAVNQFVVTNPTGDQFVYGLSKIEGKDAYVANLYLQTSKKKAYFKYVGILDAEDSLKLTKKSRFDNTDLEVSVLRWAIKALKGLVKIPPGYEINPVS